MASLDEDSEPMHSQMLEPNYNQDQEKGADSSDETLSDNIPSELQTKTSKEHTGTVNMANYSSSQHPFASNSNQKKIDNKNSLKPKSSHQSLATNKSVAVLRNQTFNRNK